MHGSGDGYIVMVEGMALDRQLLLQKKIRKKKLINSVLWKHMDQFMRFWCFGNSFFNVFKNQLLLAYTTDNSSENPSPVDFDVNKS